jgi:hypothetical protein
MNQALLDRASDFAFQKLKEGGGSPNDLSLPLQTVVVIYSAQGVIDNGGLEYFYESDFHNEPPYSFFSDAYRRIGADEAADCIEKTATMFGTPDPHLKRLERWAFLERVKGDETNEFTLLSNKICGDQRVWEKLAEYIAKNYEAFEHA